VVLHGEKGAITVSRGDPFVDGDVTPVGRSDFGHSHLRVIASARASVGVNGTDDGTTQLIARRSKYHVVVLNVSEDVVIGPLEQRLEKIEGVVKFLELFVGDLLDRTAGHETFESDANVNEIIKDLKLFVESNGCFEHQGIEKVPLARWCHRRALALAHTNQPFLFQ
jgi:hypothetical protein